MRDKSGTGLGGHRLLAGDKTPRTHPGGDERPKKLLSPMQASMTLGVPDLLVPTLPNSCPESQRQGFPRGHVQS